jgi:hypothetical protein
MLADATRMQSIKQPKNKLQSLTNLLSVSSPTNKAAIDLAKSKPDSQTRMARHKYPLIRSQNLVKPVSDSAKGISALQSSIYMAGHEFIFTIFCTHLDEFQECKFTTLQPIHNARYKTAEAITTRCQSWLPNFQGSTIFRKREHRNLTRHNARS